MKKLSIVLPWLGFFAVVGGIGIFSEYFVEHQYYLEMLASGSNRELLLGGLVCGSIPLVYRYFASKVTTKGLLRSGAIAMLVFAYLFIAIRDTFVGAGFVMLPINITLMMGGASIMIGGMWSGGAIIYRRLFHHEADTLDRSITALILGFVAALMISWVLVMTTLLFQPIAVLCIIACGYLIYREQGFLSKLARNVSDLAHRHLGFDTWSKGLTTVLLVVTIAYLIYGIMLAYIPYPTAWDANHAYMYFPKVWAEHNGYLRNSLSAQFGPSPWLTLVAVWFQFGYAFQSLGGWIRPDTWAVMMNYLISVPVVMIMVWGLVRRVIRYMSLRHHTQLYQVGRVILLSWLTSGMGAFLVFVDNKSDFGILAITLCALVLLFDWLPRLYPTQQNDDIVVVDDNHHNDDTTRTRLLPIILSGLIAGVAVFAKPTSLFDFATVVVLFAGVVAGAWAMVGTGLSVMGLMAVMKITTVPLYISQLQGAYVAVIGLIILAIAVGLGARHNLSKRKSIVIWGATMIGLLVVFKTPIMLWRQYALGYDIGGAKSYVQGVLMGYQHTQSSDTNNDVSTQKPRLLLAQDAVIAPSRSCTLQSQGLTSETLYEGTSKAVTEGAGEDLGRYIGYGGKTRDSPRWGLVLPSNTCISFDNDARALCDARLAIQKGQFEGLATQLQGDALELFAQAGLDQKAGVSASYIQQNLARQLTLYRQDKIILKDSVNDTTVVSIPYRYIVPLNMTYNWSLQNLSSYYTDVGVVWLVLLMILVTSTIWLLIYYPRRALLPLATVIAWIIWWVSGSSILWYGIGLIIWTMLSMIVILDTWTDETQIDRTWIQRAYYVLAGVVGLIVVIQLLLNFIRIGSQGGAGIFVQYKTANGNLPVIDEQFQQSVKTVYGISGKDVFDLQFPHYNKTINAIDADPNSKDAVLIAGTYMPYFIYNQYNIIGDGFLTSMWEWFSDGDVCKSYLRLQDKDLTYLVIDPNIASVVMGEGNITLRDRMFAKIDPSTNKIVKDGAISMLARLVSAGYIELFSTNNLAAKYAFVLSDADITSVFGGSDADDIALIRTKLSTIRFWGEEGNTLLQKILQIMAQRMSDPQSGISDVADIFGKDIDVPKLAALVAQVNTPAFAQQIVDLSQDERFVVANYLTLINSNKSDPQQYQQQLVGLLQQSIGGGSQLITFKVQ